jgi:hypothetical protein
MMTELFFPPKPISPLHGGSRSGGRMPDSGPALLQYYEYEPENFDHHTLFLSCAIL